MSFMKFLASVLINSFYHLGTVLSSLRFLLEDFRSFFVFSFVSLPGLISLEKIPLIRV